MLRSNKKHYMTLAMSRGLSAPWRYLQESAIYKEHSHHHHHHHHQVLFEDVDYLDIMFRILFREHLYHLTN